MRLHQARRGAAVGLAAESGSFLVEAMVSALIVLIAGVGVLRMMDRGSQIGAQQKALATAANLAQSEQEQLRAEPLTSLSNLRRSEDRLVDGVTYDITSRTDWINDDSGTPNCATAAASADYMKLTTTVSYPAIGTRRPIRLETIVAPPARSFGANQGSLAVEVLDAGAQPVPGLTLSLAGPATLADSTNANGCVLWGYLASGGGYTVGASQSGYVQPNGSPTISAPASVIGDQTANVQLEYDLAGGIRTAFETRRPGAGAAMPTAPLNAMVESSNSKFVPTSFAVTGSMLDTGLGLFPFAAPYSVYADRCTTAEPPPASLGSAVAPRGSMSAVATVRIPALNILVQDGAAGVAGAVVHVTSPCGVTYTRSTDGTGLIDDPGFPYGTLAVCVSDGAGTRHRVASADNTNYSGTNVAYDIAAAGSAPGACPA